MWGVIKALIWAFVIFFVALIAGIVILAIHADSSDAAPAGSNTTVHGRL